MREQIEGIVEHIVFQNEENGYTIAEINADDEKIVVCGTLFGISIGEKIIAEGEFIIHPTFGEQFKILSCEYRLPETIENIKLYLSSGALAGIGPVLAKRIVDKFGLETFNVIQNSPNMLAGIKGLNPSKVKKINKTFNNVVGIRETVGFLSKFNIQMSVAVELYKHYGENTVKIINENPYLLCYSPSYISFSEIDKIAYDLNIEKEGKFRISAGILYVLRYNLNNGHTCVPKNKLISAASNLLSVEIAKIEETINILEQEAEIIIYPYKDYDFCYLPRYFKAEMYVAMKIKEFSQVPVSSCKIDDKILELEKEKNLTYAPLQKNAIESALANQAFVLTGGPGTGKTTTINAIISMFEKRFLKVSLCAPTGRAAKRIEDLTGKKAQTIHRLLQVDFKYQGDEIAFVYNEKNPLKCDVVIVDEMSMVDVILFESLLLALKPSCKLILVGDSDQLPSVGAGNVLKSIIDSKRIPSISLQEIFRQSAKSLIVSNAHKIVEGQKIVNGKKEDDFFVIETNPLDASNLIVDLACRRLPAKYNYSIKSDIQVLCPSRIGQTGAVELNKLLQEKINPKSEEKAEIKFVEQIFRIGDKVMQIKNNYDIVFTRDNGELGAGAYNGDIGLIESIDAKRGEMCVRFDDKKYFYTREEISQLELAYAITIHKSQGSEFSAVIIPISSVPQKLMYRNLLYTGVTRAKNLLIAVGYSNTIIKMIENNKKTLRYSCLELLINDESIT